MYPKLTEPLMALKGSVDHHRFPKTRFFDEPDSTSPLEQIQARGLNASLNFGLTFIKRRAISKRTLKETQ
jgi:hypothetical protein